MTSAVSGWRRSGPGPRRLEWVDQAKGLGIIFVVFGHVIDGARAAGVPVDAHTFRLTWDALYAFHIPLFFFLSGLFFPQSLRHRGVLGLLLNKVDTLLYPYVIWSLLQGFAQVLMARHVNNPVTVSQVLQLWWHPRQEFWFLYALFFTYLFACLLYLAVAERWRPLLVPAAVLLFWERTWVPRAAATWYPTLFLPYFLLGAVWPGTARWVVRRPALSLIIAVPTFVIAEVFWHELAAWPADSLIICGLRIAAACAGIAATLAVSAVLASMQWSFIAYIGKLSLQIYVLHTMAAAVARVVMLKVLHITSLPIHLIVATSAGVLLPLAFAWLLERWKIPGFFAPPPRLQLQRLERRAAAVA